MARAVKGLRGRTAGRAARFGPWGCLGGMGLALMGCTTTPPPAAAPPAPAAAVMTPAPDPRLAAAAALAERGRRAEAQQRWLDAVTAREAALLLQPDDRDTQAARDRAVQRRDAAVADALARGRDALKEGDSAVAQRHFLQVLAWSPGHAVALQALQALERQRAERHPRRFAPDPALRLPASR